MTETPKCPYCGAEMELVDSFVSTETLQNQIAYRYSCEECKSISPREITPDEALSAALHRAEPKMRPLTLNEICAKIDDEDWNVVWIEGPDSQKAEPMCPYYKEENKIVFCAPPFVRVWEETISRYGKSWRCWLRKPTAEEMESEKWEE